MLIDILNNKNLSDINIICVFTTQKEVASRGAKVALNNIENADFTIVIDSIETTDNIKTANGPVVCFNSNDTSKTCIILNRINDICKNNQLIVQKECSDKQNGDLKAFKSSKSEIPSVLLGVPCKYKNSATEVMSIRDINDLYNIICKLLLEVKNGSVI